jgi:surface antigen
MIFQKYAVAATLGLAISGWTVGSAFADDMGDFLEGVAAKGLSADETESSGEIVSKMGLRGWCTDGVHQVLSWTSTMTGSAGTWDNEAAKLGHTVDRSVAGCSESAPCVLVWEPGFCGAHSTAGHVGVTYGTASDGSILVGDTNGFCGDIDSAFTRTYKWTGGVCTLNRISSNKSDSCKPNGSMVPMGMHVIHQNGSVTLAAQPVSLAAPALTLAATSNALALSWTWSGNLAVVDHIELKARDMGTGKLLFDPPRKLQSSATNFTINGLSPSTKLTVAVEYVPVSGSGFKTGGSVQTVTTLSTGIAQSNLLSVAALKDPETGKMRKVSGVVPRDTTVFFVALVSPGRVPGMEIGNSSLSMKLLKKDYHLAGVAYDAYWFQTGKMQSGAHQYSVVLGSERNGGTLHVQ